MFENELIDLFKVMVVPSNTKKTFNEKFVKNGFVTDFNPTKTQADVLKNKFKALDVTTLFTREERENSDPFELIAKQFLHYIEVYGLNTPGLFNLEVTTGKVITLNFIKGVTEAELGDMVRKLLYTNAPVKDAVVLKNIINHFNVAYDINQVANNELRVLLFDVVKDKFTSGDDVVRLLCYMATGSALLIKSEKVVAAFKNVAGLGNGLTALQKHPLSSVNLLLSNHVVPLSQVFNRHKKLIMALKNKSNRATINRISHLSKVNHVPVREALNKRFISEALNDRIKDYAVLDTMSLRDKFKFLNLLQHKKQGLDTDAFIIRNGKVHVEKNRPVFKDNKIDAVAANVLDSIAKDLAHLKGKNILLDANVDYGLPVSRKQALGNLPFGTAITIEGKNISSGIYWENSGGANDLDLSTVNEDGYRVGWGSYSGYAQNADIMFSGDVTSAPNGAMEFMTSKTSYSDLYGLFVNIFRGEIPSKAHLVVGPNSKKTWIDQPVVKEEMNLESRGTILGFVKKNKFIVFTSRTNGAMISGSPKDKALIARGLGGFWTVQELLSYVGVNFDVDKDPNKEYDYSLTYSEISYDKLEKLFQM